MLRFLVGLLIVLGLFCLVWTFLGENVFIWALIIGVVLGGLGLLFLPMARKGPEYAYRKWVLRQSLFVVLVIGGPTALVFYMIVNLTSSTDMITVALLGLGLAVAFASYTLGWAISPPTRRRGWLRRRYPAVAKAIGRYQQREDRLEDYTPALLVDGKRYFLIYYHDKKDLPRQRGILLLDETGKRESDKDLVRRAAKCKTLALQTIDYNLHQQRAAAIANLQGGTNQARAMFGALRANREMFVQMGPAAIADWDKVLSAEDIVTAVVEEGRAVKMVEAEWAEKHGLGKLTEVAYEDVVELEEAMTAARREVVEALPRLMPATESARRLAQAVHERGRSKEHKLLEEGLLGIGDLDVLKGEEAFEYGAFSVEQWEAWRERMAWADEVDARLAEAPA